MKTKAKKALLHNLVKVTNTPSRKEAKKAEEFISRFEKRIKRSGKPHKFPPLKNRMNSAVALLKHVKLTVLSWENPITKHIIGYHRAYKLGLTGDPNAVVGIVNPKTHKLVGVNRAKQLGILTSDMLNHRLAV